MNEVYDEGCKVGGEADRLLAVERVSGAGMYHEPRDSDSRSASLLIDSWNDCILIAPDNEGGGLNLVEFF